MKRKKSNQPSPFSALDPALLDPGGPALSITGLIKKSGRVSGYQLSNGVRITREQGVTMAKNNRLTGVGIAVNQGTEYLRTHPDSRDNNNLGNLPSIKE